MLEPVTCVGCGREIWTAPDVPPLCSRCEAGRRTCAELAFVVLVHHLPADYAEAARAARAAWELDNVVWLHGFADGRAVWRAERPPGEALPGGVENDGGPSYTPPGG